ncbi:hypothetical protein Mapa_007489 [Marchantia paleacea]|nr:hypothetical protein Mapa_007489 [Marchantia paleacea]
MYTKTIGGGKKCEDFTIYVLASRISRLEKLAYIQEQGRTDTMAISSIKNAIYYFAIVSVATACSAQLSVSFYNKRCPNATVMVRSMVDNILNTAPNFAGGLLRLQFHNCFLRGCDASVLLNMSTPTNQEKDAQPNVDSLRGFQQIENIKTAVEAACPGIVSCADILPLVARDATVKVSISAFILQSLLFSLYWIFSLPHLGRKFHRF